MIPFLKDKNKSFSGVTIDVRKPDQKDDSEENQGLMECMRQLMTAVQSGDAKAAAEAFKDAFQVCESYPHSEYSDNDEMDTE